jgi:hypothetical protein
MNSGEVGDDKGSGDGRVCEEVESRLSGLELILLGIDVAVASAKLEVMGEVARGVVEWERCSSGSKSRGVMGLGIPGM